MQIPPLVYGTLPSNHSRTPSDPVMAGYHTLSHTHKRSPSNDSTSNRSVMHLGSKSVQDSKNVDKLGHLKRPQNPPPPAPNLRLSNGRSTESISSIASDVEMYGGGLNPMLPPRRVSGNTAIFCVRKLCVLCICLKKNFDRHLAHLLITRFLLVQFQQAHYHQVDRVTAVYLTPQMGEQHEDAGRYTIASLITTMSSHLEKVK